MAARSPSRRRQPVRRQTCPALELLEARLAPACTVDVAGVPTQLQVLCDGAADRVTLDHEGSNTFVTANGMRTTWSDGRFLSILVQTAGGDDQVDILASGRSALVNTGAGRNAVNLGQQGSTLDIAATVDVRSTGGAADLQIDASADRPSQIALLSSRSLSGLTRAVVTFLQQDLSALTLRAGPGGNTFTITEAPTRTILYCGAGPDTVRVRAVATGGSLTVLGEAGNDMVHVGSAVNTLAPILGPVAVHGDAGTDSLNIYDQGTQAAQEYLLNATSLTRPGRAALTYTDVETLEAWTSSGGDLFSVASTARGTQTSLHVGAGNDRLFLGTATSSLDNFQGPLGLDGGPGTNVVQISDFSRMGGVMHTIDTSTIYRTGASDIVLEGFSAWLFRTEQGDDQFRILSIAPNVSVSIDLGDGIDELIAQDIANFWTLTGLNSGTLNSNVTFQNVENLSGGSATDTFAFANAQAGVAGWINGGTGADLLNYAALIDGIYAILWLGAVSGVATYVASVENVRGSAGSDYIAGDMAANALIGGPDADWVEGREGKDVIVGGTGGDILWGGAIDEPADDEDILIGGATPYDGNITALNAIRAVWAGPGDYTARVTQLASAAYTYPLNPMTLVGDGETDLLVGGLGSLDWYLLDGQDGILDYENGETVTFLA